MIDLGQAVILEEANATITVGSKVGGYYNSGGQWVGESYTNTSGIRAVIQPAAGRILKDVPEGIRDEAQYIVWVATDLSLNDIVRYGADDFRVLFIWNRQTEAGYTRAAVGLVR